MKELEKFKFSIGMQLRWGDLDPLAHVNNSIYIQYFEFGRGKYIAQASKSWDWHKNMFLIANISCDYKRELTFSHVEPKVWVRASRFGNKSFDLEYLITSKSDDGLIIHAQGKSVQVMYDTKSKKSIQIPDWVKEEINQYESAV